MKFTIENYISQHANAFGSLDIPGVQRCLDLITRTIRNNKKIITCGNGGSASTASHYITDWNKMYNLATGKKLRGVSLTDNVGIISAYGNDISYDDVFAGQIDSLMDEGDLLIVISGSGNSINILKAIEAARKARGNILGVLGYDGGKVMPLCDELFHTRCWDMQICEDIHLSFGHLVMKAICGSDIII